jgi:hypothetical protein
MKNSPQYSLLLALALGLGAAASVHATDEAYKWSLGAPGYSGTIILDSDSSSGGSLADIVSISVSTPGGSETLTQANIGSVYINNFDTPFTWNPSQITSMWIAWYTTANPVIADGVAGVGEQYAGENANFEFYDPAGAIYQDYASPLNTDTTGTWLASGPVSSVPDAGSTSLLLGVALTGLGFCRRFGR